MIEIAKQTAAAFDCKVEFDIDDKYPPTVNSKKESDHIQRLGEKYFGKEYCNGEGLPFTGSEDFAYYLMERPGCFYGLGTKMAKKNYMVHTSNYDYNDSMIASGAYMFLRIVEDRLDVKIFNY